jgi:predicted glycoside hydrolase/deacetylase ChbG (UPF0249 family)
MAIELIGSGDDFGLSEAVSLGVLQAYREGIVTSTSLMINVATSHEFDLLNSEPGLGVGVHVNLTRGPAMSSGDVSTLVDSEGNFTGKGHIEFPGVDEEHIRRECRTQVEAALDSGVRIDHLDSHHHAQRNRMVFNAMKDLAVEKGLAMRASDAWMVPELRAAGVCWPDYFIDNFFGREVVNIDTLLGIVDKLGNGVTELMCHPGYFSTDTRLVSGYLEERALELATLTDKRVINAIRERGIILRKFGGQGK